MSPRCSTCDQELVFAYHVDSGKIAPLEEREDGTFVLTSRIDAPPPLRYRYAKPDDVREGATFYGSHFATCRQASEHRRERP